MKEKMHRNRWIYTGLGVLLVALGLGSRSGVLPPDSFVATYSGDALWAALVYVGIAWLRPCWPIRSVAAVALLFALAIETSQLWHPPWLDALRATRLGGLVLGYGFLWSDLVAYAVGIGLAAAAETLAYAQTTRDAGQATPSA